MHLHVKRQLHLLLLCVVFIVSFTVPAAASKWIESDRFGVKHITTDWIELQQKTAIGGVSVYGKDYNWKWSLDSIRQAESQLISNPGFNPGFGYPYYPIWQITPLIINTSNLRKTLVFSIENTTIDNISSIVLKKSGTIWIKNIGEMTSKYEMFDRKSSFLLVIEPYDTVQIVTRMYNRNGAYFPTYLWSWQEYHKFSYLDNSVVYFCFGISFIILLFNIIIVTVLNDQTSFYYFMYTVSMFFVNYTISSGAIFIHNPEWSQFSTEIGLIFSMAAINFFIGFLTNFDATTTNGFIWINRINRLIYPTNWILAVSCLFIDVQISSEIYTIIIGIFSTWILYITFLYWNRSRHITWLTILIGWIMLWAFSFVYFLNLLGVIPFLLITNQVFQVGNLLETIIINLVIINRIREFYDSRKQIMIDYALTAQYKQKLEEIQYLNDALLRNQTILEEKTIEIEEINTEANRKSNRFANTRKLIERIKNTLETDTKRMLTSAYIALEHIKQGKTIKTDSEELRLLEKFVEYVKNQTAITLDEWHSIQTQNETLHIRPVSALKFIKELASAIDTTQWIHIDSESNGEDNIKIDPVYVGKALKTIIESALNGLIGKHATVTLTYKTNAVSTTIQTSIVWDTGVVWNEVFWTVAWKNFVSVLEECQNIKPVYSIEDGQLIIDMEIIC
jgi:hypothetical protein